MEKYQEIIPIFFAVDDKYVPFLAVTLQSLLNNASQENYYVIKILYTNMSEESKEKISKYTRENVNIEYVDLNYYIEKIKEKLYTRDYFSMTTYFRLFISNLYPQYNKAIYLDCDIVLLKDIAELYNIDIGDNLLGAVPDDIIQKNEVFQEYVEKVVGVANYKTYFNAGMLVMNLDELRKFQFQEKFLYLLENIKFSVIQDQDYLNRICKGRVKLIDTGWNLMPTASDDMKEEDIKLIHYNYQYKPWHYDDIRFGKYFWELAKQTEYYDVINKIKENFTDEMKYQDRKADIALRELAQKESDCVGDDRMYRNVQVTEKSQERIEILEKIKQLEKEGKFDVDAENDPPTIELTPDNVDYLKTKRTNKWKNKFANKLGERFLDAIIKDNKLIIKDVEGLEYLSEMKNGAIITCNHFNPFDSFTIEEIFSLSGQRKKKKLYKVIREGNYTNFPGFYGFLFRNADTLPLSSNTRTMIKFMQAADTILKRGDFILIYPEQSLWWNYEKPKPLKNGAYKIATRSNVPVIPIFITMKDSNIIGEDGFPIKEYYVHIEKPIYPDVTLSEKENVEKMKNGNFEVWKNIYEEFYGIPLEYTTVKEEVNEGI